MTPFELIEPHSLREAAALLEPDEASVRPVGGGTAVMLMMKLGVLRPTRLISLRSIETRYSEICIAADGALQIGAMTTLSTLERSPLVQEAAPVIAQALRTLSNVRVRNVATLGGHLAHADPHLDLPPVLIALGAHVKTVDASGGRTMPLETLYTGYFETSLGRGELIAEVIVPRQALRRAAYLKCTTRSADDWPALGIAVVLDTDGSVVREARVVVSAATDTPTRLLKTEDVLRGVHVSDKLLREAGDVGVGEITVQGDAHGSASYKKELLRVYIGRAVRTALQKP